MKTPISILQTVAIIATVLVLKACVERNDLKGIYAELSNPLEIVEIKENTFSTNDMTIDYTGKGDTLVLYPEQDTVQIIYNSEYKTLEPLSKSKNKNVLQKLLRVPNEQFTNNYELLNRRNVVLNQINVVEQGDSLIFTGDELPDKRFVVYALQGKDNTIIGVYQDGSYKKTLFIWRRTENLFGFNPQTYGLSGRLNPEIEKSIDHSIDPEDYHLIVNEKRIGAFQVGKAIPKNLPALFSSEYRTEWGAEATEIKTLVISERGTDLFKIYFDYDFEANEFTDIIKEIRVVSDGVWLDEGKFVNSTLYWFLRKYRDAAVWYSYISGLYVLNTKEVHLQFLLDGEDYRGSANLSSSDMVKLRTTDFSNGTRIKEIRIY